MNDVQPIDYVVVGLMNALHARKDTSVHSLTVAELKDQFEEHNECDINDSQLELAIRRLEHMGAVSVVLDPYADTLVETNDKTLQGIATEFPSVIKRGWDNENWLRSALQNPKLWEDISGGVSLVESVENVPSADGFVSISHNTVASSKLEEALVEADEAIRSDNGADTENRGWIRAHLEAGLLLLRRGEPILRSALLSLVLEPLKAAAKAAANVNAKALIEAAISAVKILLGL